MENLKQLPKHYTIVNGMRHFNRRKTMCFLLNQGKKRFGKDFQIQQHDIPVINKLIAYAIHEEEQCEKRGVDLNKGILLSGPIGCGKTTWMHLIQTLCLEDEKFQVKSAKDIAAEFNKDGYDTILTYGKRKKIICIDDIGVENSAKFFGNECNTIAEILLCRYDLLINHKVVTYATTNLSPSQLEALYGGRVRSRLRSMFNLITFPSTTPDKRR
jgi:DNA replication protein DnaC